jgi:hypothetical protein
MKSRTWFTEMLKIEKFDEVMLQCLKVYRRLYKSSPLDIIVIGFIKRQFIGSVFLRAILILSFHPFLCLATGHFP